MVELCVWNKNRSDNNNSIFSKNNNDDKNDNDLCWDVLLKEIK